MLEWHTFFKSLPSEMKRYITDRMGDKADFQVQRSSEEEVTFISSSSRIEVNFYMDLYGCSISIWFPESERNNSEGDPTVTDHQLEVPPPFGELAAQIA